MRHRHWSCNPRGHIEIEVPGALLAMGRRSGGWGPFHFEFDDNGWGGRRGGRRSRRMFESGELRLVLLKLIADGVLAGDLRHCATADPGPERGFALASD